MFRMLLLVSLFIPLSGWSQSASFSAVTDSEFEDISKEFSGNFMHHSVQGAAPLGDIFGFEVGLVGGQQGSPSIDTLSKRSGGSGLSNLYHAGILGVVSVPLGITGELMVLPRLSTNDAEASMTSLGLKLSLNSHLLQIIPFNLALRGIHTTSKFSFNQTISGVTATVEDESVVSGFQVLASPSLPLVEPYAGIGFLSGKNRLGSNIGSVFSDGSASKEKNLSSTQLLLGVTANLLFFHVGAEYSSAFGANSITGKLAFGF